MANKPTSEQPETKVTMLKVVEVAGEDHAVTLSKFATKPEVSAAATAQMFSALTKGADVNHLVAEMNAQTAKLADGDMTRAESMLLSQAHTLDAVFNEMARRAALNMPSYPQAAETYLRMALKAQGQCRATLQTLGDLKAPRSVAFIQQANVSNGPQQVNNGKPSRASEQTQKPTNELLEASHGEWMDTRAQGSTSGVDPAMAAMAEIDRAD
ncbi:hypothetical protein [Caballeronia sp. dw_276]|uniref:hypothetical protein n=1 Tax=Caballeronia sp. dw_276 TaxID=2719795 RepID=UPI001BD6D52A|nr:hypothetical protein [Caballeronia sp. dw_276]